MPTNLSEPAVDRADCGRDRLNQRDAAVNAYANSRSGGPERESLRSEAIAANLGLVGMVVRSFLHAHIDRADLMQVGTIGLITALDRFDPTFGAAFATFALPHIAGQIRHYLRDELPIVQIPRRILGNATQLRLAREELIGRLHREPSRVELARAVDLTLADVVEALDSAQAIRPDSWDEIVDLTEPVGSPAELELIENRETIRVMLNTLSPRARTVLVLHFWHEMSQAQIAVELGITQVSVSRILAKSLRRLRAAAA